MRSAPPGEEACRAGVGQEPLQAAGLGRGHSPAQTGERVVASALVVVARIGPLGGEREIEALVDVAATVPGGPIRVLDNQ